MSVRSFTKLCPDAPAEHPKLSTVLRGARSYIVRNEASYICVALSAYLIDNHPNDGGVLADRVRKLLSDHNLSLGGRLFYERLTEVGEINAQTTRAQERAVRLVILDVLIAALEARGE